MEMNELNIYEDKKGGRKELLLPAIQLLGDKYANETNTKYTLSLSLQSVYMSVSLYDSLSVCVYVCLSV